MSVTKRPRKALRNKTCKQIADLVVDYLNDELNPKLKREFRQHLRICPDCVSFFNTYKKTVSVTGSIRPDEIPPRVRDNVLDFLRGRLRKSATSS